VADKDTVIRIVQVGWIAIKVLYYCSDKKISFNPPILFHLPEPSLVAFSLTTILTIQKAKQSRTLAS
jgi:hypothetical protein